VVDEVLAVGDAEFQKKAIGKMQDISKGHGRTVLYVSHNMESIRHLCNRGILLKDGMVEKTGEIEKVVNNYIDKNIENVGDYGEISDLQKHRISATTKEIEIIKLKRINDYKVDAIESLKFHITLKKNEKIEKFQVFGLIDDVGIGGHRVGIAYSEQLICPADENSFSIHFRIDNHNLGKGKYIMDFWIGLGDIKSGIKYYDAVYDTLSFEIDKVNGSFINEWHHYWGQTCYHHVFAELV
jgi:lipopolysaccharide transport system ATP-binding protein